jgi:hypothetical protein
MVTLFFGEHNPLTVVDFQTFHPCDLPAHEERVAADIGITVDLGLSPTVLSLVKGRPDWLEGFLQLAKRAEEGITPLKKHGAPSDLYLLKRGKVAELGSAADFQKLWDLTPTEWSELVSQLQHAPRGGK